MELNNMTKLKSVADLKKLSLTELHTYQDVIKDEKVIAGKLLHKYKEEQKSRNRSIGSCDTAINNKVAQSSMGIYNEGDVIELQTWNGWVDALGGRTSSLKIIKINNSSVWVEFLGKLGEERYRRDNNYITPDTEKTIIKKKLTVTQFKSILKSAKDKTLYKTMEKIVVRDSQLEDLL